MMDTLFDKALARAPFLTVVASVLILAAVFVSQYGFGLAPCQLCIWQRWAYAGAIAFGLLAFVTSNGLRRAFLCLTGLAFAAGCGIAAFHVGVEQHWWAGLASCSGTDTPGSVEELRALLAGKKPVRCDEIAFQFLGLSMAGWNVVASFALAVFTGMAVIRAASDRYA